jgi:hypothetical protein
LLYFLRAVDPEAIFQAPVIGMDKAPSTCHAQ